MKVKILCTQKMLQELISAVKQDQLEFSDEAPLVLMEQTLDRKTVLVKENDDLIPLSLEQIVYFESLQSKVLVHTEKTVYEIRKTLTQLEAELREFGFIRIHRAFLVNRSKIVRIRSSFNMKLTLILSNQDRVEVSRNYYTQFKAEIGF